MLKLLCNFDAFAGYSCTKQCPGQGGQCSNIVKDFSYHNSFLVGPAPTPAVPVPTPPPTPAPTPPPARAPSPIGGGPPRGVGGGDGGEAVGGREGGGGRQEHLQLHEHHHQVGLQFGTQPPHIPLTSYLHLQDRPGGARPEGEGGEGGLVGRGGEPRLGQGHRGGYWRPGEPGIKVRGGEQFHHLHHSPPPPSLPQVPVRVPPPGPPPAPPPARPTEGDDGGAEGRFLHPTSTST